MRAQIPPPSQATAMPATRRGDQGGGMGSRQGAELEVVSELGFSRLGRCPEKIEGSEDGQSGGHAAAVLGVHEKTGQGDCPDCRDCAESGVENEVGRSELVDPVVLVQKSVVQAKNCAGRPPGPASMPPGRCARSPLARVRG